MDIAAEPIVAEPIVEVRAEGARLTLLGTAHVSRVSAETVVALVERGQFDAIAVELCPSRQSAMLDPDALARLDLFAVIRDGRAYMVAASLVLSAYQQRLAAQCGIEPGAEQRAALRLAAERQLPALPIDREIGTTLRRVAANLGWWRRWQLFVGLLLGMLSRDQVDAEEIERLKQGDMLETAFAEFAEDRGDLFVPLIAERDRFMAARLRQEILAHGYRDLLVVIGAGHLRGLAEQLRATEAVPPAEELAALQQVPPKSRLWRLLPWGIVAIVLAAFAYGFTRSPSLGWDLVADWVLINGGLTALGALAAAAHPLTVIGAFCAAPLTSLNPTIGAGMVAAALELFLRRPTVGDFHQLREAVATLRGWWRNRVSRVLLLFFFATLGSAIGTYVAGFRILGRAFG